MLPLDWERLRDFDLDRKFDLEALKFKLASICLISEISDWRCLFCLVRSCIWSSLEFETENTVEPEAELVWQISKILSAVERRVEVSALGAALRDACTKGGS